jgi:hypothetical protein
LLTAVCLTMRSPQSQEHFLQHDRFGESKRTRKSKIIIAAILVALALVASFRIYSIDESSFGWVMWNASEAYLFVQVSDLGYKASGLELPWILFKQLIGGFASVVLPEDDHAEIVVIRVNSSGVERHVLKLDRTEDGRSGPAPSKFTPLEGRIYAFYPKLIGHFMQDGHMVGNDMNDGLGWWAGDHFEKATEEERSRLDGIEHLTTTDFDNDANGWSRRVLVDGRGNRNFSVDVGEHFRILVNYEFAKRAGNNVTSIELVRPGRAPETIGNFSTRQGTVSRSDYTHTFRDR